MQKGEAMKKRMKKRMKKEMRRESTDFSESIDGREKQNERNTRKKRLIARIVLLVANVLFCLTVWLLNKYDRISLDQFLYQLKSPASGVDDGLMMNGIFHIGVLGILLTVGEMIAYLLLSGGFREKLKNRRGYRLYCATRICSFFREKALPLSLSILLIAAVTFVTQLDALSYIYTAATESDFIETHYVSADDVALTFPEGKRNLIYIYLESMESTFGDTAAGEVISEDYISELTALAQENIRFSHTDGVGGALSFTGTTWTAASLVAQTAGIPVKVPLGADDYNGKDAYMPGVVTLGDILRENGYTNVLLVGSDAEFAGRESYFTLHGQYEVLDIESLKAEGRLPEDYREWWGFEDKKLFAFAKEELLRLSDAGEPFNFTMLTADTHFPDGYVCENCGDDYAEQYANVLSCSSRQVANFVSWIKEQSFYENTTIVLCGDHLTMDPEFLESLDENYMRTIYNCIINADALPVSETNRQFGVFDLFPTTLAALGVSIEGDRLGLGTNLFSSLPTLTEQYGYEAFDGELRKKSQYYIDVFLEE